MNQISLFQEFLSQSKTHIPIFGFIINLVFTGLLSLFLKRVYIKYGHSLSNRDSFGNNFLLISMTTMLIITIVKSSLALSLGLVGALSIIRFRAAIKEPEELAYLFIAISIGLGFGANQGSITLLALIVIVLTIVLTKKNTNEKDINNLINLTVISEKSKGVSLDEITKTIKKNCSNATIKRLEETPKNLEISFLVSFSNYNMLLKTKDSLQKLDKNINILYLDSSQFTLS